MVSTLLAAGSSEQWLGSMAASAPGQSRWAIRAATALMKPSMTTGTPSMAPPMNSPAMPQMSNPPSLLSTSKISLGSGRFTVMARSMAQIFRCKPASLRPAPRPVTVSAGRFSRAATRALEVVVLPMPISPDTRSL